MATQTWDADPFTVPGVLSPYLPLAAELTESFQDIWHVFAKQSAAGQLLAVSLQEELLLQRREVGGVAHRKWFVDQNT